MVRTLLQKAITRLVYPFIFIVIFIFFSCQSIEPQSGEEAYQSYCGSCHLPTDVRRIPKRHWKETILPQMGALLGRKDSSYNPFKGMSMQEAFYIKSTGAYPEEPKFPSPTGSKSKTIFYHWLQILYT